MKINWGRVLYIMESILMVSGFVFLMVLVHEFTHMIDGYSQNVAVCFGFINWQRAAFVINGDNYSLFRGEPLAYFVNIVIISIVVTIYRKGREN